MVYKLWKVVTTFANGKTLKQAVQSSGLQTVEDVQNHYRNIDYRGRTDITSIDVQEVHPDDQAEVVAARPADAERVATSLGIPSTVIP